MNFNKAEFHGSETWVYFEVGHRGDSVTMVRTPDAIDVIEKEGLGRVAGMNKTETVKV